MPLESCSLRLYFSGNMYSFRLGEGENRRCSHIFKGNDLREVQNSEGYRTLVGQLVGGLVRDSPNRWVALLKNLDELEVKVHCNGVIVRCSNKLRLLPCYDIIMVSSWRQQ